MKTLSRKKLLVGLIALFTALCALFGVLSMPRSVSADSTAFDWSKYDDPANYTETVIYDKEEDATKTVEFKDLFGKVIRVYGYYNPAEECYIVNFNTNIKSDSVLTTFKSNGTGTLDLVIAGFTATQGTAKFDTAFSEIDYRVAENGTYVDFFFEEGDAIIVNGDRYDLTPTTKYNTGSSVPGTVRILSLELDEVKLLPNVEDKTNILDDVTSWVNDNLGINLTAGGVVIVVVILFILFKKK